MCLVKVQETLDRIGPIQSTLTGRKERLGVVDMVDDDVGRLCRIVDAFQSRIELFDEGEIQSAARGMLRQIQTRNADQVEPRKMVRRPQDAADCQVRKVELFQAANVSLGRPRSEEHTS